MREQEFSREVLCALGVLESAGWDNLSQLARALGASEHLTRALRERYEASCPKQPQGKKPLTELPGFPGAICVTRRGWLHIRLDTLLPHCRYETPSLLSDTLALLLEGCARSGPLPFFSRALVVIEEWSDIGDRRVFDQDNKGWKAIPNALKGVVTEDDDQYSMELALLARRSRENCCHICVLDAADAADFFAWRAGRHGDDPGF